MREGGKRVLKKPGIGNAPCRIRHTANLERQEEMIAHRKPPIPQQPVFSAFSILPLDALGALLARRVPSVLDAGVHRSVTSARIALTHAFEQMRIGVGDTVLVPAYHCRSMVEPVLAVGARPVFYKVTASTSVDLDDIGRKLAPSTKALLVVNYFGLPQDLLKLREFCDRHGIFLLEDCAHAFFGKHAGRPLGSFGDYAVASAMKFFPVQDGGFLVSARHQLASLDTTSAGLGFEVKSLLNTLERGFEYSRLRLLGLLLRFPIRIKDMVWATLRQASPWKNTALAPRSSDGGEGLEIGWLNKRASLFSRCLIGLASRSRIAARRRENYLALHKALEPLPGCRPLFASLPPDVYPYVFPAVVDDPEQVGRLLKSWHVPVIRFGEFLWEGVDESVCATSVALSRKVFQFPCHQELSKEELDWMIEKIRMAVLAR